MRDLHPHKAVNAVDSFFSARASVLGLTTRATPIQETPRIEGRFGMLRGVDDATVIHPPEKGDVELWLDFGREVVGFVELELEAPDGTIFDFNGFEYLDPVQPDRVQWTNGLNNTFRYIARRGWQRFRSTVRRGFRYATLTIRFPKGAQQPVHLRALNCLLNVYPYEARGAFACSDPLLNQIYEMSRETVRLCSEDTFVDCPTYEQTFWVGDARNEALFAYAGFGDYLLARRCLLLAGHSLQHSPLVESQVPSAWENILTTWALLWTIACYGHYRFTGDRRFVEEVFPAIRQQNENLHTQYTNSNGLLEIQAWNMLDWAGMDTPREGIVSHQNMWLVKAYEESAKLAEVLGETLLAQNWRQWARDLRDAINQHLWVETQRAYTDCLRADGQPSPVLSQQTQVVAYLCNIPTPERKPTIEGYLHQVPDSFVKIGSPFMMAFLIESLMRGGYRQEAVQRMREAWGMMVEMGAVACWEVFPQKHPENPLQAHKVGWFTRSHCHAWSAAPVYALPTCLLGIEPLEPGFSRFRLEPNLCGLDWAYGVFPTPLGDIHYAMESQNARLHLKLTVPANSIAVISTQEYPDGTHTILL